MFARSAWPLALAAVFLAFGASSAVELELSMPADTFAPGRLCRLELEVRNTGDAVPMARLFVALDAGTGEYWFHPGWTRWPGGLDWSEITLPAGEVRTLTIVPEFVWPAGVGAREGCRFLAAVLDGETLLGEPAEIQFGWVEGPAASFREVPAGLYTIGSPEDEMCRHSDERSHEVILSRGLRVQETETTQAQWASVFGSSPAGFPGADRPIESVSWHDACLYCNRLSLSHGFRPCYYTDPGFVCVLAGEPPLDALELYWDRDADGYRLPTESEWEVACRAGSDTAYHGGEPNLTCTTADPNLEPLAWYCRNSQETHAVGGKQANAWGLRDMHGNVWEWCWDLYAEYPAGVEVDPAGPEVGSGRVERGGCWMSTPRYCRSAIRNRSHPTYRGNDLGFRPVRVAPGGSRALTRALAMRKPMPA